MRFVRIYDLKDDRATVEALRRASSSSAEFDARFEHGECCSDEWWDAISTGAVPSSTVRGIICANFMGSLNGSALFQILSDDGDVWEPLIRQASPVIKACYQIGRRVEWTYADIPLKTGMSRQTLSVSVAETKVLYRPVGPEELALIRESGFRFFPPRLPEQPIFYPVLTREYAVAIARDWNSQGGKRGYVTRFEIDAQFLDRYEVRQVGRKEHIEYWIPAEELDDFNRYIVGKINVVESFPKV